MKYEERKYRVNSLEEIRTKLRAIGAKAGLSSQSLHYYTRQKSNDVVKLVVHERGVALCRLKEHGGQFSLVEKLPVATLRAGIALLKGEGYTVLDVVKMRDTDYHYQGGIIGLYTVNDVLYSVIVDCPAGLAQIVEATLGLQQADRITVPYNKYLKQIGNVDSLALAEK